MNPLIALQEQGQSIWLDYIRRDLMTSGELKGLVEEDGLRGLTSNPTIFENAISKSSDYDKSIQAITSADRDITTEALYEKLAIEDIQMAADILKSVYDSSDGADGFVSLEVSPHLAYDTAGTVAEARRLWEAVDRPNLLIKVPATRDGIPAIETLLAQGINVNVTLMFSLAHYEAVASAYTRGLERNAHPEKVASVASFFVSRVDTAVDPLLEAVGTPEALAIRGKIAIANSQRVYGRFREIFYGEAFAPQKARGGRVQRPLWGSTSTKNPAYSDVLYVESLIGPDTVNTVPLDTLNAFRDHGQVRPTLLEGLEEVHQNLAKLPGMGIDLDAITEKLQVDGVAAFAASYNKLLAALDEKRKATAIR
jgi:transaldolase